MDEPRQRLIDLSNDRNVSLQWLSEHVLGRNHAYLQQYINRGSPRALSEIDRLKLSEYFGESEDAFKPQGMKTTKRNVNSQNGGKSMIIVPELDARAGAGNIGQVDTPEETGRWMVPPSFLRHEFHAGPEPIYIISVEGDSMAPTLAPGDRIFVDTSRTSGPDGLYVLHDGSGLYVKRLEKVRGTERVRLISDNPHHSAYDLPAEQVHVFGRVIGRVQRL